MVVSPLDLLSFENVMDRTDDNRKSRHSLKVLFSVKDFISKITTYIITLTCANIAAFKMNIYA